MNEKGVDRMEMFNAIRLLDEAFGTHGLKYQIHETDEYQEVQAFIGIKNGPSVAARFISQNHGNDLMVRIMGLVNDAPAEKRFRIMEACNQLNNQYRFLKFEMTPDNNVNVEYDFPVCTGDACLGEMALEIFVRMIQILNQGYSQLAKVLYMEDELMPEMKIDTGGTEDFLKLLKDKRDEINIKISKTDSTDG